VAGLIEKAVNVSVNQADNADPQQRWVISPVLG
jgi:hypothetical protein